MTIQPSLIRVGSIVHLENGATNGGYLDTRGWINDKPIIDLFYDPHIQGLVSTHQSPTRLMGSGSWLLLSAQGKANGTPLKIGDEVHLFNMFIGAGYLDSFEWVPNLKPFNNYPMIIGVFTANVPKRGGGPTGTWTIQSPTKQSGESFSEGDTIYLENNYPGAGFLHSYGRVRDNPLFSEYEGQEMFVFTGPLSTSGPGSPSWTITLDSFVDNLYHIQTQWGDVNAPWHEGGMFKMGSRPGQPITKLSLSSPDNGQTLTGHVTYQGETPLPLTITHHHKNSYRLQSHPTSPATEEWHLGSRDSQRMVALEIEANPTNNALIGTITYTGECPIRVKARPERDRQNDPSKIYYDFFNNDLLKGRTAKLEGVIDTTYRLLTDSFIEISGTPLDEALQHIHQSQTTPPDYDPTLTQNFPTTKLQPSDAIDYDFQIKQLLNIHTLSTVLNAFFRDQLQETIKQLVQNHQLNKTPPPLHQIRASFQRVATDHELLQQATIQRRWNKHSANNYCMSEQATELLVMDKIALKAITPCQHLLPGHPDRLAIITYLSDKTHIHRLPYTDQFILVGISYDRVPPADNLASDPPAIGKKFHSSELMAIPHEVGHYLYNQGQLTSGQTFPQISQKFTNNPYYRWSEELFADLYGCLIAGPLSALGLQALLLSTDWARAWKDDEDHPTPLLRPFILADMMQVIAEIVFKETSFKQYDFPKMTTKLEADWARVLEQWGYERMETGDGRPQRIYLPDPSAHHLDKVINIQRVIETTRPIIIEFAHHLIKELGPQFSTTIPWVRQDSHSPEPYNQEMANLTDRQFAHHPHFQKALLTATPNQPKIKAATADEQLQWYLDNWDDKGPHGWGGH